MKKEKIAMPVPFENRTIAFKRPDNCKEGEEQKFVKGKTNPETWQFVKNRYVVLKGLIEPEIIKFCLDTWKAVEHHPNSESILNQENRDITYKNPKSSIGKSVAGYSTPWGIAMHEYLHRRLDDVLDLNLGPTYTYTRKYLRGAYLGSHVDRPSCEVSATICLDYKTDDNTPWPIWIRNDKNFIHESPDYIKECTQDIPQRLREENNCRKVLLEPGDVMMYQGPNAPHWRDYLLGDYSYHMFIHFYNRNSRLRDVFGEDWFSKIHRQNGLPGNTILGALELDGREHIYSTQQNNPDFTHFTNVYNSVKDSNHEHDMDKISATNDFTDWEKI